MNLKCFFGFHKFDQSCRCLLCGVIKHDFEECESLSPTGNYETSTEPWLTEMDRTTYKKCRLCGEETEKGYRGTAYYL